MAASERTMRPSDGTALLRCTVALPADYRAADVLAFHARDRQMLAERVSAGGLDKGLLWNGRPALLSVSFGAMRADISLAFDSKAKVSGDARAAGNAAPAGEDARGLRRAALHMLGLNQPVEDFEARYQRHPLLGRLISGQAGLRVPQTASPFEALSWAIIGQQVSVSAAVSIRRKFIQAAGERHSSGLWCFPDAGRVAGMEAAVLRNAGFSQGKAKALLELSRAVAAGTLPLDEWLAAPPIEEMRRQLLGVRGIGPWTVSYVLLRGFGWLDGSLHGDVAVRRNLGRLLELTEKVTEKRAEQWLTEFSPWRALVAAHLWAMRAADGY